MSKEILNVFIDGASRGNPGPAGLGVYVYKTDAEKPVLEVGCAFHRYTNNVAEYAALVLALHTLIQKKFSGPVFIHADSLLVVKQMNREFKVKDPLLQYWNALAQKLRAILPFTITHVRREYNAKADALANKGLDEKIAPPEEFERFWRSAIPRMYWPAERSRVQTPPTQTSLF